MTNAMPTDATAVDVVALIQQDHRSARALLARISDTAPAQRKDHWPEVVRVLAVHEVAEEMVVFPAIRAVTTEHHPTIEARIAEQVKAEELLVRMEDMDPATDEFAAALAQLRGAVIEHADAEEREVLPLIVEFDEALDRATLGARYEAAKRRAPTHPHPHAPHEPPGNLLVGPVAAFMDRMRDHLR